MKIQLSAGDVAKLKDLPAEIETLLKASRATIDAVKSGGDASGPVGKMFGTLGDISKDAQSVPALQDLMDRLRKLTDELPASVPSDIGAVGKGVEEILGLLGPLRDMFLSGKVEESLKRGVEKVVDLAGTLGRETGELAQLGGELREFFKLFSQMLQWKQTKPSAEDVARLLCRALAGLPMDLLTEAGEALEKALHPLEDLRTHLPDLPAWRDANDQIVAFWLGVDRRLNAPGPVDWAALRTDLQGVRAKLVELTAVRDRLVASMLGSVAGLQLPGFDAAVPTLKAIPQMKPFKLTPILDGFKLQIQGMIDALGSWTPTEEDTRKMMRELAERILSHIDETPLGELRVFMINFQQTLLQLADSLPLRDYAVQAEEALLKVADAVEVIDPQTVRQPIHDFFEKIADKVKTLPADEVRTATGDLWNGVEDTMKQVADRIESLRTTIQGVAGQVTQFVQDAGPALDQVRTQVDGIYTQLDQFDLDTPTDSVVDALHDLRDKVAGLDLSSLPDAAVSALKIGAEALRQIDLTSLVKGPLDDALAKVDPTPLLQKAAASLGEVTAQLKSLSPEHVVARLDAPVVEIADAIHGFGPEQMRPLLMNALKPARDAILTLDFSQIVAPLTHLQAEFTARVDAVLDPEIIFHPLEDIYHPVEQLVDAIDPQRLMGLLNPHAGKVAGSMGPLAGPPASLKEAGGALRTGIQSAVDTTDALFGFRPGDMLVPLIDLHRSLMQAVEGLETEVVDGATALLRDRLGAQLDALAPQAVQMRLRTQFDLLRLEFDPTNISFRLEDAARRYSSSAARIAAAAQGELSVGDRAIVVDIQGILPTVDPLQLLPSSIQSEGIHNVVSALEARIDIGEYRNGFAGLSGWLGEVLPSFLAGTALNGGGLNAILRELDPAPLRDEINALFDQLGQKLVGFQDVLLGAIEEVILAADKYFVPLMPSRIIELASQLHGVAKEQIQALGPARFKDEIGAIFDAVKRQLAIFDPSQITEGLDDVRAALLASLDGLVDALLPPAGAFDDVAGRIAALKPSVLLADSLVALKPLSELIAQLDPSALLAPLIEVAARVRAQLPEVLAKIEAAVDEVLAAFPDGGSSSAGVSDSASISA